MRARRRWAAMVVVGVILSGCTAAATPSTAQLSPDMPSPASPVPTASTYPSPVATFAASTPTPITPTASPASPAPTATTTPTATPKPTVPPGPTGWSSLPPPAVARSGHLAVLLHDGTVLVVGGSVTDLDEVPTERFDPIRSAWSTGPTTRQLSSSTLTVLADGRVLLAGGIDGFGNVTREARLYDPGTSRWTKTGSLAVGRAGHTATMLEDGSVLVVGGGIGMEPTGMDTVERFDPIDGTWSAAAPLGDGRVLHASVRLGDGSVLSIGGVGPQNLTSPSGADILASAERYDPADDHWRAVRPMSIGRLKHDAVVMDDGSVVVIDLRGRAERFVPATGRWAALPEMRLERTDFAAALLLDGTLLVTGGMGDDPFVSTEILDLADERWRTGTSMLEARRGHSATRLADGSVLVVGGADEDRAPAERFVP